MRITHAVVVHALIDRVWTALSDPQTLAKTIPGCDELLTIDETSYVAKATIKVGFITAKFDSVRIQRTKYEPKSAMTFEMEGQDSQGRGGFKQKLSLNFVEKESNTTEITFEADLSLSGIFATLGRRVAEHKAREISNSFVSQLSVLLESA